MSQAELGCKVVWAPAGVGGGIALGIRRSATALTSATAENQQRFAGKGAQERVSPEAHREQPAKEESSANAGTSLGRPVNIGEVEPEGKFIERESGAHTEQKRRNAACPDGTVFGTG